MITTILARVSDACLGIFIYNYWRASLTRAWLFSLLARVSDACPAIFIRAIIIYMLSIQAFQESLAKYYSTQHNSLPN